MPIAPWPSNEDACYRRYRTLPRIAKLVFNNGRLVSCCLRRAFARSQRESKLPWCVPTDWLVARRFLNVTCLNVTGTFLSATYASITPFASSACTTKIPSETESSERTKRFQQPVISSDRRQFGADDFVSFQLRDLRIRAVTISRPPSFFLGKRSVSAQG